MLHLCLSFLSSTLLFHILTSPKTHTAHFLLRIHPPILFFFLRKQSRPIFVTMSTIQQLKNFIRHGMRLAPAPRDASPPSPLPKLLPHSFNRDADVNPLSSGRQARDMPAEDTSRRHDQQQHHHQAHQQKMAAQTEPAQAAIPTQQQQQDAYSVGGQNRAAQAAYAAAKDNDHRVDRKSKKIDEAHVARIIAEENAKKNKFPHYPGLERWELIDKMGDGAFSNVYKARDRERQWGEVAIKVVRKFEMNSQQVSDAIMIIVLAVVLFSCSQILKTPPHQSQSSPTKLLPVLYRELPSTHNFVCSLAPKFFAILPNFLASNMLQSS